MTKVNNSCEVGSADGCGKSKTAARSARLIVVAFKKMAPKRGRSKAACRKPPRQLQQLSRKQPEGVKLLAEEVKPHMRCGLCHQADTKDILQAGSLYRLKTPKVVLI